jgi:hypothetical protein
MNPASALQSQWNAGFKFSGARVVVLGFKSTQGELGSAPLQNS